MRATNRALPLLTLLAAATLAAHAAAPDGALRIHAAYLSPTGDLRGRFELEDVVADALVEADTTVGLSIGWEVGLTERLGIETGLTVADFDFDVTAEGVTVGLGSATMIPITAALHWHFTQGRALDVYAGPQLSYTVWGDLDGPFGTAALDAGFDFGLRVGLDALFSEHWAFSARLEYMTASAGDSSAEIDVDPLVLGVGLSYRY